jgi:O-antigen/teichoic acid export membrane protein
MVLLVATQASHMVNIGFTMVVGRALSDAEYSILQALLNAVLIVSAPVLALRMVIAHYTARFIQSGRTQEIKALLHYWNLYVLVAAAVILAGVFVARGPIASFLNLERSGPVLVMGLVLALNLYMTLLGGALHGMQAFRWLVSATFSWAVVRLVCAAGLVLLVSATATNGLLAQFVATLVFIGVAAYAIRRGLRGATGRGEPLPDTIPYFWRSCVVLVSYAVLMYSDMILVRRFLPGDAGPFAYAATIGRTVIFLPMPIAVALFPKVISEGGMTGADRRMLRRGIAYGLALTLTAVAGVLLLPKLALLVLFGMEAPGTEQVFLVRAVVLAMSPLGLAYILMNFELAQHRFAMLPGALLIAVAYIAGVALFHDTPRQVIAVLACVSTAFLVLMLVCLPRDASR